MDPSRERAQLIELVGKLQRAEGTDEEQQAWLTMVEESVPHPQVSDLIYYPEVELSAEEIVDLALAYRPLALGPKSNGG